MDEELRKPSDLAAAIEPVAETLTGIERRTAARATEYLRRGVPFALVDGQTASFRLRSDIAAAALRTPDTARSTRGSDWISLQPAALDQFALDRARAWFESAWRLAGEGVKPH